MVRADRVDYAGVTVMPAPFDETQKTAVIIDRQPHRSLYPHKELIKRLLKGRCELCRRVDGIEVHHIHKLADLAKAGTDQPAWIQEMARRRRKTLVVCWP